MNIALVGNGNMAHVLGRNFLENGHTIVSVHSRNQDLGNELAHNLSSTWKGLQDDFRPETEFIILCISDDYISEVSSKIKSNTSNAIVAHTSGSVPITAIDLKHDKKGVFYPLQTIRKDSFLLFKETPICINSDQKETISRLQTLAESISKKIYILSDDERKKAHLSAVVINNFTNHLVSEAYSYLNQEGIPISVVQPLLKETMNKLLQSIPDTTQTGPARRNDIKTIESHLNLLGDSTLKNLYQHITDSIINKYNKK